MCGSGSEFCLLLLLGPWTLVRVKKKERTSKDIGGGGPVIRLSKLYKVKRAHWQGRKAQSDCAYIKISGGQR